MKIVSLLPSATEIICSLGLIDHLVGVTHECDYPSAVQQLPVVTRSMIGKTMSSAEIDGAVREQLQGSTALYSLRRDVLNELQPDLIVTQALCDVCAVSAEEVNAVASELPGPPRVINLEPSSLEDVFDTIKLVAQCTGHVETGDKVLFGLRERVQAVESRTATLSEQDLPRVAMLEWLDPLFNAGHWTPQLIAMAGGRECLGNLHQPSEQVSWQQLADCRADVIGVALCGFDLKRSLLDMASIEQKSEWAALPAVEAGRVYLTDGNAYFSRSGPRLVDSLEVIAHALHPDLHPAPGAATPALQREPLCR